MKRYWPAVLCGVVLAAQLRRFHFITDDAYISFVYARNLARHGQLVYNLGERVEGYTNFLWTLLLAIGHRLGADLPRLAGALSLLFSLGTLAVVARVSEREAWWTRLVAPALLVCATPFVIWTSGGLETAMFTFLVTSAIVLHLEERPTASGSLFGLAAMTRPEGLLFFAIVAAHRAVTSRKLPRRMCLAFAALLVPYLAFRVGYYGHLLPNTYYAKQGAAAGGHYVASFLADFGLWFALPLLIPVKPIARWQLTFLSCVLFGWYVVRVGGDFMGMYRFLVPLLPLAAMHVEQVVRALPRRLAIPAAASLVGTLAMCVPRNTRLAENDSLPTLGIEQPGFLNRFARERAVVGRWFGAHGKRDDLLIVGGAGAEVFHADMRAVDVFGLTDPNIARLPPVTNYPGHTKHAPLEYLLSRRPDFLLFNDRAGFAPYVPTDEERARYRALGFHWVTIHLPELGPKTGPYLSFLKRRDRAIGPLPAEE